MSYQYEALGPEKFQQLCQALLTKEFPNTQCFPVGQPDGGRDATALLSEVLSDIKNSSGQTFAVFQVKFVRNPLNQRSPHTWLEDILKGEIEKVRKLIARGASAYYLLTNVSGTAHLDVGAIDRVQTQLSSSLGIPCQCWWRDDLDRRLDNAWDLKWHFPDVLSGSDVLRYIVEEGLSSEKERRSLAIRAYVQGQYDQEREVRFKQVELQNSLFDLFIDIPVSPVSSKTPPEELHYLQNITAQFSGEQPNPLGVAALLLDPRVQLRLPRLVIEGAPGQGKSTVTQFVCQVYRTRILGKETDIARLSPAHRPVAIRVPFRVELRHLATWLSGQDPFSSQPGTPNQWNKSLEAFLAAQVRYFSGGVDFSVADLLAVAKVSSLLVVFDGLDEVAGSRQREDLVQVVTSGVSRLQANSSSLQVIITSRPMALPLTLQEYPVISLQSLGYLHISSYAEQWTVAKQLRDADKASVLRTLVEKLRLPHIKDLSRNTMQLAILLSLIYTRGASLPDKRTALYDSYVSLFFDRECEKSEVVRDNRDLLIDIHRYLAWHLHSSSESGSSGSISGRKLREVLRTYLERESRDPALADVLFAGMVERVVFLVSRVEGLFEFEVQPLREYFAARYLYETAPYSPPGYERRGTKPDRFDAIARNLFWTNVTRFYAGCFSKGELPALVDLLQDLVADQDLTICSHPYRLASMLVSDWVFSQNPKSLYWTIHIIENALTLCRPMNQTSDYYLQLPSGPERQQLMKSSVELLRVVERWDYASEIIAMLKKNTSPEQRFETWNSEISQVNVDRSFYRWLRYGAELDCLLKLPCGEINALLTGVDKELWVLEILLGEGRVDFLMEDKERVTGVIQGILDGNVDSAALVGHPLGVFSIAYYPDIYDLLLDVEQAPRTIDTLNRYTGETFSLSPEDYAQMQEVSESCNKIVKLWLADLERPTQDWLSSPELWDEFIECSRREWGDRLAIYRLAIKACSKVKTFSNPQSIDFFDHSKSLCNRLIYAKTKRSDAMWWNEQMLQASSELDRSFLLLAILSLVHPGTIVKLAPQLDTILGSIPSAEFAQVIGWSRRSFSARTRSKGQIQFTTRQIPPSVSQRFLVALASVLPMEITRGIYRTVVQKRIDDDLAVLDFCFGTAHSDLGPQSTGTWVRSLRVIADLYPRVSPHAEKWIPSRLELLPEVATSVLKSPCDFPRRLVYQSDAYYTQEIARKVVSLDQVSSRDGWF